MTTQGIPPHVKLCPQCGADNRPLAPSCSRCGFNFRTAARVATARRNRNLGWVSAGVVALVLTGFASYYLWYAAHDPLATPHPTSIERVALAATPTPLRTPGPTPTPTPTASPIFRLLTVSINVPENCCNTATTGYSKVILQLLPAKPGGRVTAKPVAYEVTTDVQGLFAVPPQVDASGRLTFRTAPNQDGTATVSIGVKGDPASVQRVTITVQHVNQPPVANDDVFRVPTDASARQLDVLANDFAGPPDEQAGGANADTITIADIETGAAAGTVTISSDRSALIYTPPPGFSGSELVRYRVRDGGGLLSGYATVYITVGP